MSRGVKKRKDLSSDEGITDITFQPKLKTEAILTFQNITIHLSKRVSRLRRKMFHFLFGMQIENIKEWRV
jgi:hypothetical protein